MRSTIGFVLSLISSRLTPSPSPHCATCVVITITRYDDPGHPIRSSKIPRCLRQSSQSVFTTLRKRDKKREKQRAELLAKRKQRMAEPVVVDGPKRGNGRRKRQRKVKAAIKQEQAKERVAKRDEEKAKAQRSS
ncbi:hypothetical protein JVT61DRAFT_4966 [Boletus reticuloceps]|uniref:Uncharacterized protein n=1 Tax=Boletus reticuloceps TaxID=495285 RepID=A0A8I2Z1L0_9AGAM|nr:hypothetical protein JVT61DRAFT_4966 [Boletus reticuloceps]